MQQKFYLSVIVVIAAVFTFGGLGMAQDKTNVTTDKPKISAEAQAVQDLSMAGELTEYGRRENNPLALVVAAQIMKNTPTQEGERTKTSEGDETASASEAKKEGSLETPEKLLAEAKEMAKSQNNEMIVALIDKENKIVAQRGRIGGPVRHVDRILAGDTDIYRGIRFRGGQQAGVVVIGDGDCDIDLSVYDENGNLVGSDRDSTDRCIVTWTPKWSGPFTIKVKNYCSVYANYVLATN